MNAIRKIASVGLVLALTYLFTSLWLNSAWSESFWTWLNLQISAGQNPGLASDLELIVTLVCSLVLSAVAVLFLFKAWSAAIKRRAS